MNKNQRRKWEDKEQKDVPMIPRAVLEKALKEISPVQLYERMTKKPAWKPWGKPW